MLYACEKQAPHANIYVVINNLSCQPEFKERIKKKTEIIFRVIHDPNVQESREIIAIGHLFVPFSVEALK